MKEKHILKISLPSFESLSTIEQILTTGYQKTGNKFQVAFNGSKGYLSNIEISCEGSQIESNRIFVESLKHPNGRLKDVMIDIYHSNKRGVRLSISI